MKISGITAGPTPRASFKPRNWIHANPKIDAEWFGLIQPGGEISEAMIQTANGVAMRATRDVELANHLTDSATCRPNLATWAPRWANCLGILPTCFFDLANYLSGWASRVIDSASCEVGPPSDPSRFQRRILKCDEIVRNAGWTIIGERV